MVEKDKHGIITEKTRVPISVLVSAVLLCLYLTAGWYDLRSKLDEKASVADVQQVKEEMHGDLQDFHDQLEMANGKTIVIPPLRLHQAFRPAAPITTTAE